MTRKYLFPLLAGFFGLLLFITMVFSIELFTCLALDNSTYFKPNSLNTDGLIQYETNGWLERPHSEETDLKKSGSDIIYDVVYKYDNYGRRTLPQNPKAKRFAIFMGGSNTFGQGLEVNKTIAYKLQQRNVRYQSYNYAIRGFGPYHALAQSEFSRFGEDIQQTEGVIFYIFFPFHVYRTYLNTNTLKWNGGGIPLYIPRANGGLARDNSALTKVKKKVLWLLSGSYFFQSNSITFPKVSSSVYTNICTGFKALQKNVSQKVGPSKLYILAIDDAFLQEACDFNGQSIELVDVQTDLSGMNDDNKYEYIFKDDGHWREKMVDYILEQIEPLTNF